MKQLAGQAPIEISNLPASAPPLQAPPLQAPTLPLVTRFRDPTVPYEDLIQCERDCIRCSYAATLGCDGNCGACPRQSYCPCVNPARVRSRSGRLADVELPLVADLGRN